MEGWVIWELFEHPRETQPCFYQYSKEFYNAFVFTDSQKRDCVVLLPGALLVWCFGWEKMRSTKTLLFPYHRRYPTVEIRAETFNGSTHVPVPSDSAFLKALLLELRLIDDHIFVEHRDTCTRINHSSVYSVRTEGGDLWPVLAFQKSGLIYACLPLVEETLEPRPPLLTVSGLSQGLALLLGIVDYISPSRKNEAEMTAKIGQLRNLLIQACPLGTPLNTNIRSLNSSFEDIQEMPTDENQPAWRSNTYKGKPQVNVCITEKVKCTQYDIRDVVDTWQVYGAVNCKVRAFYVKADQHTLNASVLGK